jgi:hypothetical protein
MADPSGDVILEAVHFLVEIGNPRHARLSGMLSIRSYGVSIRCPLVALRCPLMALSRHPKMSAYGTSRHPKALRRCLL